MNSYPDFVEKCGYGHVQGIGGANCRHSFWPYIEGVSERTYTDAQLEGMKPENRPKTVFEGREYDDYQATQKQRQIERTIRKLKRRKTAFEAAGLKEDALAAGSRLRILNQKYREFSKAAGLPEQRERMKVQYVDDASLGKAEKRLEKTAKNDILKSTSSGDIPVTEAAIEKVPQVHLTGWSEELCVKLEAAHKELLRFVKGAPVGTEAAAVYTEDMRLIQRTMGETGKVRIKSGLNAHVLLHTHPDGLTFSSTDVETFINSFNMSVLTAVGNDGSIYAMQKTENYIASDFVKAFVRIMPNLERAESETEFADIINEFLNGADKYGVKFIQRR